MLFFSLLVSLILFLYMLRIIRYAFGWNRIKRTSQEIFSPVVSIVIAIRNEESQLDFLLKSLASQIYSKDKLEVILVNDHSTDNSLDLLERANLPKLRILNMPEGKCGKKHAIRMAVSVARGDVILASDADCVFTPDWVGTMASYFLDDNIKLVSAPVSFRKQDGLFQSLQALEFSSLIGSGAGAIGIKDPIFCNGANMAYRKEIFLDLDDLKQNNIVSGDDVFLLHSVKAKYPNSIVFAKDKNAIVTTESAQNFSDFFNQRKRWVAKSTDYKDISSVYTSYLVFFTNISFILVFFMVFFDASFLQFFLLFYVVKFAVDCLLLVPVLRFLNRKDLIKWIFSFELFYSFYIILIVILSFAKKFEWKGRMHRK